jgi:cysteine desulfurase/selenocysteine lyase
MPPDWSSIRAEFPALARWTYLNTAAFGQLPRRAVEAVAAHFAHRDELACHDFLAWYDDADAMRRDIAALVNCAPDDVAFLPSAAAGLGLLINGIDWKPGDRLVTLADEFPNNLYYPALLARRGAEFVETPWERFYEAVTDRTKLVVMSTVNYSTGLRPPVEEVAEFLRARRMLLYLDGTQSVGALRFNCARVRPAMLVVHGYKWLVSPSGAGFLYVDPELRRTLEPNVVGWRSHRDWRNVDDLHHGAPEFVESAEKYEGGNLVFPSLYGMGASVRMMLEIGPEAIERRVLELAGGARDLLRRLGAELPSDRSPDYCSGIVASRFSGRDPSALARGLRQRGVLVSARHGCLRISTHFYNDESDLDRLRRELAGLL